MSEEPEMSLAEKIQKDLVDAMRAKDELRLSVLRGIKRHQAQRVEKYAHCRRVCVALVTVRSILRCFTGANLNAAVQRDLSTSLCLMAALIPPGR